MFEVVHEHECPYLADTTATTDYRLIEECSDDEYQQMLERGWRRFGCTFFRPVCRDCCECRSLRLDVDEFQPSRSMRRIKRKNRDLQVLLQPASLSHAHLELYGRYHEDMSSRRGWDEKSISPGAYFQTFVEGKNTYGHELLYMKGDRLLGVALVDILPASLSAVYCYYDPNERSRGLGVFSVLTELEIAKQRGLEYVYLGYWIEGNASMRYKARYRPHEILQGRPGLDESPAWQLGSAEPRLPRAPSRPAVASNSPEPSNP